MRVTYDDPNQRAAMMQLMELVTPDPTPTPDGGAGMLSGEGSMRGSGKVAKSESLDSNGAGGLTRRRSVRKAGF